MKNCRLLPWAFRAFTWYGMDNKPPKLKRYIPYSSRLSQNTVIFQSSDSQSNFFLDNSVQGGKAL